MQNSMIIYMKLLAKLFHKVIVKVHRYLLCLTKELPIVLRYSGYLHETREQLSTMT